MFSKIVIALNELPESQRALNTAIEIAASFNSSLATVSIFGDSPVYTSFAIAVDPAAPEVMKEARRKLHSKLHANNAPCSVLGVH